MNTLQVFSYNGAQVRTVEQNGEPWWVLKDVREVLELDSPHKVAERLDEDEKGRNSIPTLGEAQEMTIISESGGNRRDHGGSWAFVRGDQRLKRLFRALKRRF